jgi:hypothetical protein
MVPAAVGGGTEAAAGDEDATIDEPTGALDKPSVEEPADD